MTDLDALGKLLMDEAMEVVIHDADYDLRMLQATTTASASSRVFDTFVAAELLNEPETRRWPQCLRSTSG